MGRLKIFFVKYLTLTLAAISLLFVGCMESAIVSLKQQQDILDSFKRIDSSLVSTSLLSDQVAELENQIQSIPIDSANILINQNRKIAVAAIADISKKIRNQMDLSNNDEDTSFTNKIFFREQNGAKLYHVITNYKLALKTKNNNISDSVLSSIIDVPQSLIWEEIYFKNTPIIAAITMLDKIQRDIQRSFLIAVKSKNK